MFEQFERLVSNTAGTRGGAAVDAWARLENAACARRMSAMVAMLDAAYAVAGSAQRDQWYLDNWGAVSAQIGACQRLTPKAASDRLLVAVALRDRFPKVVALFEAGLIDYPMARLITIRGGLVTDPDVVRELDAQIAEGLAAAGAISVYRAQQLIDGLIWELDPEAVRRTQTQLRGRGVQICFDDAHGTAELVASMVATHARALDARLDALATTVCPGDPRTRDQLRSDALGAVGAGTDRLACLCGDQQCPASNLAPCPGVVIHLVVDHDTLTDDPPPQAPNDPDEPVDPVDPEGDEAEGDEAEGDDDDDDADAAEAPTPEVPAPPTRGEQYAGLHGPQSPLFPTIIALREMTLAQALSTPDPGYISAFAPAVLFGHGVLPGVIARHSAQGATIVPVRHPGQAPPEPGYRPSATLADFVRCRDLTCRFPGCKQPATTCDVDHTIPWPYGPTQASNLKCLCRHHHLVKTFWSAILGWRDRQLPDGTVTWTDPDGGTHTTEPGSRSLFPRLCAPTAPTIPTGIPPADYPCGLTMPRRRMTRAQDRLHRIHEERERNRTLIDAHHTALNNVAERRAAEERAAEERAAEERAAEEQPAQPDSDPPPF